MGARRNFSRGGGEGQAQNRPPPWSKKLQNGPHMVKKAPYNEKKNSKNGAKRSAYEEKVAKRTSI